MVVADLVVADLVAGDEPEEVVGEPGELPGEMERCRARIGELVQLRKLRLTEAAGLFGHRSGWSLNPDSGNEKRDVSSRSANERVIFVKSGRDELVGRCDLGRAGADRADLARLAVRAYPAGARQTSDAEIIGTLRDAGDTSRGVFLRELTSVTCGGLAQRTVQAQRIRPFRLLMDALIYGGLALCAWVRLAAAWCSD